jgi:hypothetical protein
MASTRFLRQRKGEEDAIFTKQKMTSSPSFCLWNPAAQLSGLITKAGLIIIS